MSGLAGRRIVLGRPRVPALVKVLLSNPLSLAGLLLLVAFAAVAIAAPVLAPVEGQSSAYRIPRDGFKAEPQPPDAEHRFGTTQGQYDIYHGVIWGTRTAFKVGLIVTGGALLIGLSLGSVAGYFGGWVDEILMRITEVFMAFPFLLAAITLAAVIKSKSPQMDGLYIGIIAIVSFTWMGFARVIRGDVLATKGNDYVTAARAIGAGEMRILTRHVLPNSIQATLVVATLEIGSVVLAFSALSFLGLGTEAGYADWGQMIALARNWIPTLSRYWYVMAFPGGAIVLFVLAWNLIGDGLRDVLDPRLRERKV